MCVFEILIFKGRTSFSCIQQTKFYRLLWNFVVSTTLCLTNSFKYFILLMFTKLDVEYFPNNPGAFPGDWVLPSGF